jgi:hypothetical protein
VGLPRPASHQGRPTGSTTTRRWPAEADVMERGARSNPGELAQAAAIREWSSRSNARTYGAAPSRPTARWQTTCRWIRIDRGGSAPREQPMALAANLLRYTRQPQCIIRARMALGGPSSAPADEVIGQITSEGLSLWLRRRPHAVAWSRFHPATDKMLIAPEATA